MELSKGGCKDFTELVTYEYNVESMENELTRAYSCLVFKNPPILGMDSMIEK